MAMALDITYWLSLFEQDQQCHISEDLHSTISFLRIARKQGEGWGPYSKFQSNLHQSALVIQALFKSSEKSIVGTAADASAFFLNYYGDKIENLKIEEICDLLTIINAEKKPIDEQISGLLIETLINSLNQTIDYQILTVKNLSYAITVLLDHDPAIENKISNWISILINVQLTNGGFPASNNISNASNIATAWGLRALNRIKRKNESLNKAVDFLENEIANETWELIGKRDIFTHATILLALAESPSAKYVVLREGMNSLMSLKNIDGSWGATQGQTGDIEITALSFLALVTSGKNSFIPYKIAKAAIHQVNHELKKIQEERDNLKRDFDNKLNDDCGKVLHERNVLLAENRKLKSDNNDLRKVNLKKNIERESFQEDYFRNRFLKEFNKLDTDIKYYSTSQSFMGKLLEFIRNQDWTLVIFFVSAAVTTFFLIHDYNKNDSLLTKTLEISSFILLIVGAVIFLIVRYNTRKRTYKYLTKDSYSKFLRSGPSPLIDLRYEFIDMAEDWPPSLREEIIYYLFKNILDSPPEIGLRFIEDVIIRFKMSANERKKLQRWVISVLEFDPRERRILFEQLRTSVI
jgi:hypothetical protein